mgnify:FL=1
MKLADLAEAIGAECRGDGDIEIRSLGTLATAGPDQVTFLASPALREQLADCRAGAVILRSSELDAWPGAAIICADPHLGYAGAARVLDPTPAPAPGVHESAVIAAGVGVPGDVSVGPCCVIEAGVSLGPGVVLGPGCVVGEGTIIGAHSQLLANVTVGHHVVIGARCRVQGGTVLGSDGFGNSHEQGRWVRIPQLGGLTLGDDVQVGAGTAIDRGAIGDTIIGDGVVIDNQVHIAHNVQIGAHTAVAGCVGIAGSAVIGSRCTLAGIVGVADHVTIADDVHLTGMSMVTGSISEPGVYSSGTGLMPNREWRRSVVRFRQLEQLAKRLAALERLQQ